MDRLYFLTSTERPHHRKEEMWLTLKGPRKVDIRSARRIYRVLRREGWTAKRARWAIYDLVAMRTEIGGKGYGL
jgi:hypothetical protein